MIDEITTGLQNISSELPNQKNNINFKNIDETNILFDMMKDTLKSSPYTSSIKYLKKSLLSKRNLTDNSQLRMMESSFNIVNPNYINFNHDKTGSLTS